MAEVVGLVASGISIGTLTVQMAESLVKLVSFWEEIQTAPKDVASLINEGKIISFLVNRIGSRFSSNTSAHIDSALISTCLHFCQQAADELTELTTRLATDIQKSRGLKKTLCLAKVVLSKDKVKKYRQQLESTKTLLILCQQCYAMEASDLFEERLSSITALIVSRVEETQQPDLHLTVQDGQNTTSLASTSETFSSTTLSCRYSGGGFENTKKAYRLWTPFGSIRYEKSVSTPPTTSDKREEIQAQQRLQYKLKARVYVSSWFRRRVWEFYDDPNGWDSKIRTYNTVPWDSQAFQHVRNCDIEALQKLFDERKASPFDRTLDDETLLHTAVTFARREADPNEIAKICKFLIDQGLDAEMRNQFGWTPLDLAIRTFRIKPTWDATNTYRVLSQKQSPSKDSLKVYTGNVEGYQVITRNLEVPHSDAERIRIACSMTWNRRQEISTVRVALGQKLLSHPLGITTKKMLWKLLHRLAYAIGMRTCKGFDNSMQTKQSINDCWDLFKEIILLGVDLHTISSDDSTLLIRFLRGYYLGLERYITTGDVLEVLHEFLKGLKDAGVDLQLYGSKEKDYWDRGLVDQDISHHYSYRLISFTYGESPEDWHFWFNNPRDEVVGEFWDMVENPAQQLPGAWVEDEEYVLPYDRW